MAVRYILFFYSKFINKARAIFDIINYYPVYNNRHIMIYCHLCDFIICGTYMRRDIEIKSPQEAAYI